MQPTPEARPRRWRQSAIAICAFALALAAGVVVADVVERAEARFSGITTNEGSLFSSAAVEVTLGAPDQPMAPLALRLDHDNMTPGMRVERCLAVTYTGSLDRIDIRLFGERDGEPGLDRYLETRIEVGSGSDPECTDFVPERTAEEGRLADVWQRHGSFADGLELMTDASDGDDATVRVELGLVDDDAAQGLELWFAFVIEARP